jgi:chaperone LolA
LVFAGPQGLAAFKGLPPLLKKIERKYTQANTMTAEFTQINFSAAFGTKKKSSGVIYFKRPSKIRWETYEPDRNLMVSNGKIFWFYTPPFAQNESGQVIEKSASGVQSKLANALLSGAFSLGGFVTIKQTSPTQFQLVPIPGNC